MYSVKKILKGQIYYVNKTGIDTIGSEQTAGRPAIINNTGNYYSDVVEVVYLTTQSKVDLPTHVPILSARKPSIALCEEILSVDKRRLGKYIGTLTEEEMRKINQAMMLSLGIVPENLSHLVSDMLNVYAENHQYERSSASNKNQELYIRVQAERDVYKKLYGDLLQVLYKEKRLYA